MKHVLILISLLMSTSVFAQTSEFTCEAVWNSRPVLDSSFTLSSGQQNKAFGEFEEFVFFMSSKSADTYELQILNRFEPSRTYALAKLSSSSPHIGLSIWKRDFVLNVNCTLLK